MDSKPNAEELPNVTHSKKAVMCPLEDEVLMSSVFGERGKLLVKVNSMCLDNNM